MSALVGWRNVRDAPASAGCGRGQLIRGCLLERTGEFESAAREYEEGLKVCECLGEVGYFLRNNLGYCLNQVERYQEAEECCRSAIALNPDRHSAHKNRGVALAGLGRLEEAVRSLLRAMEICPNDPRALAHLEALFTEVAKSSHPSLGAVAELTELLESLVYVVN